MIQIPASDVAPIILQALMCRKGKQQLVQSLALHPWGASETALQAAVKKARAA